MPMFITVSTLWEPDPNVLIKTSSVVASQPCSAAELIGRFARSSRALATCRRINSIPFAGGIDGGVGSGFAGVRLFAIGYFLSGLLLVTDSVFDALEDLLLL